MPIPSAEPAVYSLASAVTRFSGFFYQCYLIPLFFSALVLSLSSEKKLRPGRVALQIACTMAAAAGLYLLTAPATEAFTQIGTVSHLILMGLIVLYAAFLCPVQAPIRIVLTAAVITNINFAQSISTQILMPVLPLWLSNLIQLALLLLALTVIYVFRPAPSEDRIPTAYWLSMLVIAVLSTACLYAIRVMGGRSLLFVRDSWLTVTIILSAFFIVNLLIYYLYYVLVKEHRASAAMTAMRAKLEQDLDYYRRSETLLREYRSLRHELKNHISLMESLLGEERYDQLRQYFRDYAGKITPRLAEFHCPNPLITSLITHHMNTALAVGVNLDVIAAVPSSLGIADDDLCSLLSNMLDNGVEACLRAGKDLVRAALHTDKGCLFITVANPVAEDVIRLNPALLTTKDNAAGHGFGIPIIRSIAEKYDGFAAFHVEDGWFTADAMLYMEEEPS